MSLKELAIDKIVDNSLPLYGKRRYFHIQDLGYKSIDSSGIFFEDLGIQLTSLAEIEEVYITKSDRNEINSPNYLIADISIIKRGEKFPILKIKNLLSPNNKWGQKSLTWRIQFYHKGIRRVGFLFYDFTHPSSVLHPDFKKNFGKPKNKIVGNPIKEYNFKLNRFPTISHLYWSNQKIISDNISKILLESRKIII